MECLLCFEFYDDGKHKPHSINPCGHHFCATCLDKIKNKTCPTCRGNIQSKTLNRGILELINPEVLEKMIDVMRKKERNEAHLYLQLNIILEKEFYDNF